MLLCHAIAMMWEETLHGEVSRCKIGTLPGEISAADVEGRDVVQ